MFARILFLTTSLLLASEARSQSVTVIGPVTPGNVPIFNSPTVIKDSGTQPGGLGTIANNTVLGNVSGGPAIPTALSQAQLTGLCNVFTNSLSGCAPASGGGTVNFLRADATWAPVAGLNSMIPGGRLTVASGVCAPSTDQVSQTTLYYAPCGSQWVPIYDGSQMLPRLFTSSSTDTVGLSLALAGSANWAISTIYDAFVGLNSGVVTLCTGPAWTNSGAGTGARGSGAGTTQLALFNGLWTNAVSMTCRFGAASTFTCGVNQCTYVGSVMTSSSATGTIDLRFGTVAVNCNPGAFLSIWNQYNRKLMRADVAEATASYTYTTLAFRPTNNSVQCSVSIVVGMPDDAMLATYRSMTQAAANSASTYASIGVNNGSAVATHAITSSQKVDAGGIGAQTPLAATWTDIPGLGLTQIYGIEQSDGTNANIFFGRNSPTNIQGLQFEGLM